MRYMPLNIALISSAAFIIAMDVPLPIELTAMGMVGLILRWFVSRDNAVDAERERRISDLEEDARRQHHLKHELNGRLTKVNTTISLIAVQARRCTCEAMTPLLPILDTFTEEE